MKRSLALAASTILLMSVATSHSADLRLLRYAPPASGPIGDLWSGVYGGLHVGYSWGRDRTAEYFTANGVFTGLQWRYSANTALAGVHLGYSRQFGSFVLGAVVDAELTNARGGFYDLPNLAIGNPGGAGTLRNNWRASIRGKVGYSIGRFLPFVSAGVAFANMKYVYTNPTGPIEEPTQSVRTGYTIGAGLSYAFTHRLSATIEYRHTNYGDFRYASVTAFPGLLTGRQQPRFDTVRMGVSYRF